MKVKAVLITLLIMLPVVVSSAMDNTTLVYRESTEQDHEEIPYVLTSRGNLIHIKADFKDGYQNIVTDTDLNTKKLEISFPDKPNVISIYREDDMLVFKGEKARSVQIDPEIPWYQFLISLKSFVLSGNKRKPFFALSANFDERLSKGKGIQLMRLVAKRDGRESLEINGKRVETIRIVITFDDIRSLFWKALYWYRESDGILVRYSEVRGAPGTPETVGILIEEGSQHEQHLSSTKHPTSKEIEK